MRLEPLARLVRRRWALIAGVAAGIVVASAALFSPLVRAMAERAAEQRGLAIRVGSVRPGLGRVYLKKVVVTRPGSQGFLADLDTVVVRFGLGLKSIAVHGGAVALTGDLEKLGRELRGAGAARLESEGASTRLPLTADGLTLVYRESPDSPASYLWGAHYSRTAAATESLGADRARVNGPALAVDTLTVSLSFERHEGQRRLVHATAQRVSAAIDLDALIHWKDKQPEHGAAVDSSKGAVPSPLGGARLRSVLDRAAERAGGLLSEGSSVALNDVRLRVTTATERLNLGPSRLTADRASNEVAIKLVPSEQKVATPLAIQLRLPLGTDRPVTGELSGGPVSLAALGIQEGDFGLQAVFNATVRAASRVILDSAGRSLAFDADVELERLSLEHPGLAPQAVRNLDVGLRGKGLVHLDGSGFVLESAELMFGALKARATASVEVAADDVLVSIKGGVPLASCKALFDSLPPELIPMLDGVGMNGTFALDGELQLDTRRLAEMTVRWDLFNQCRFVQVPESLSPRRFRAPWTRTVDGGSGEPILVQSGPGAEDWTPYGAISRHMETAVLVCEDGRFFRHDGFDHKAIQKSVQQNVEQGRFVRGGSTISMQLAKNLYLKRDKTLSRKLQEAFLTMLLEQELSKQEILELYLNVIEFGPGIYGIGPAARYYFDTRPDQLTLGQSLYLASILPNPKRHYFNEDGSLKPYWSKYLHRLMHVAHKIRKIDDLELAHGLDEQVVFGQPGEGEAMREEPDDMLKGEFLEDYVDELLQP